MTSGGAAAAAPSAVLTDIEGTTTPIAFVHRVLFPFARAHMAAFIADHAAPPAVAAALAEVRRIAPDKSALDALLAWMDEDTKITPLKALQGLIWRDGYARGELHSELYPDVAPALARWAAAGRRLAVYSSGSVEAQRLLFGHTPEGDLTGLFEAFFDTTVGPKREASSYHAIASALALPPAGILFLSDVEAELDAAHAAGLRTWQLVRAADGTTPSARHPTAPDFPAVEANWGGPAAV